VLLDPLDQRAWTQTIVDVVNDEQKRTRMRTAGLNRVTEFTWRRTATLTLDAYRRAA
jgi:glycosyltransferase involved in cell wall biosynthesis